MSSAGPLGHITRLHCSSFAISHLSSRYDIDKHQATLEQVVMLLEDLTTGMLNRVGGKRPVVWAVPRSGPGAPVEFPI
jgi:hypothetical protein